MVVDTSAIVAIYAGEPETLRLSEAIANDGAPLISAGTMLELSIVLSTLTKTRRAYSDDWLTRFLKSGKFRVEAVTEAQVAIAIAAHRIYGKGMGNQAQVNFGDCFSYALAKSLNAPLLYKGGDFSKTDIQSALN